MADDYEEYSKPGKSGKLHNVLPQWGNEQTMNLNPLILANIQGSSYFKVHLFKLKTYHEVVDEIYYQVKHLEPWERGSRKTAGQTGMCGGVRGVGAGGIVSTAFCLLYKLYTLRLTRKQVNGLLTHSDSPFIRALGFMYIRYTQPPSELFDWYEEYLEDAEEVEPRAGGGQPMTMGTLSRHMLTKLDWFSTLFPRIPVPIQKSIEQRLGEHDRQLVSRAPPDQNPSYGQAEKYSRDRNNQRERDRGDRETFRNDREPPAREPSRNDRETVGRDSQRNDRENNKNEHRETSRRDGPPRDNRNREVGSNRDNNFQRDSHRRDRERTDRDRSDRDRDKSDRGDRDRSDQRERESYRDRSDRDRSKYRERSPRDRRHR